jgi:hypothetical protein
MDRLARAGRTQALENKLVSSIEDEYLGDAYDLVFHFFNNPFIFGEIMLSPI